MNKEQYEVPVTEIILFDMEDVITTSGDIDQGEIDPISSFIKMNI